MPRVMTMPLILALRRLRWRNLKFNASRNYIVRPFRFYPDSPERIPCQVFRTRLVTEH